MRNGTPSPTPRPAPSLVADDVPDLEDGDGEVDVVWTAAPEVVVAVVVAGFLEVVVAVLVLVDVGIVLVPIATISPTLLI